MFVGNYGISLSISHYTYRVVQCWWCIVTPSRNTVSAFSFQIKLMVLNCYIYVYIPVLITVYGIGYGIDTNEAEVVIFLPIISLVSICYAFIFCLLQTIVVFSCLSKHVIDSYFLILWITIINLMWYKYHISLEYTNLIWCTFTTSTKRLLGSAST